ncbi:MFS transporter [Lysobacter korlensis]
MNRRSVAMVVLIAALFMDHMDAMITNLALPSIGRDLGATPTELEWTLTGYILAFAVGLVSGGRLGDICGRKRIFLIGIAAFTCASGCAAVAFSGPVLVLARVLQGAAAALMVPQVLSTAQALYLPGERGRIFGVMTALGGVGVLAGQLLGGWLVTADIASLGWRAIFAINLPVGVLVFLLAVWLVPDTRAGSAIRLDIRGTVLAAASVFLIVFPLTVAAGAGWPAWVWLLLGGGILAGIFFVRTQLRLSRIGGSPTLPPRLFRLRGFRVASLVQAAYHFGWGTFVLMFGLYVQDAVGFTALEAGLAMAPLTLGTFLATGVAPLAERLRRIGVLTGALLQAAGFAWYGWVMGTAGSALGLWSLAIPLVVTGIGMIVLAVPLMSLALEEVAEDDAGAASGAFSMFQQVGSALGIATAGIVFFSIATPGSIDSYEAAITAGNCLTIGAFCVAGLAALGLPSIGRRADGHPAAAPAPMAAGDDAPER